MDKIDIFINALELSIEKDLQRTINTNTKIYLNSMLAARNVMDRNKGGRGGKIVNVLSNMNLKKYGCDNDQQFLINKQTLLSLTEAFAQEEFFQQTGVAVLCVTPVMDKNLIRRNYDWIKKVGLEKLANDMTTTTYNNWGGNTNWTNTFNDDVFNDFDQDQEFYYHQTSQNYQDDFEQLSHDFHDNQGIINYFHGQDGFEQGHLHGNIHQMLNVICDNIIRGIQRGQNGTKIVAGLKGVKNIEKHGLLSRL
ncbi:Adhr family protein [Megaselia abdita]